MVLSNVAQSTRERFFDKPTTHNAAKLVSLKERSDVMLRQYAERCNTRGKATEKPGSAAKKVEAHTIDTTPANSKRRRG
jgi:hypothetical protein